MAKERAFEFGDREYRRRTRRREIDSWYQPVLSHRDDFWMVKGYPMISESVEKKWASGGRGSEEWGASRKKAWGYDESNKRDNPRKGDWRDPDEWAQRLWARKNRVGTEPRELRGHPGLQAMRTEEERWARKMWRIQEFPGYFTEDWKQHVQMMYARVTEDIKKALEKYG